MSRERAAVPNKAGAIDGVELVVRLDHARNPYQACPAALEAIEMLSVPRVGDLPALLGRRISEIYGVSDARIYLLRSADVALDEVLSQQDLPLIGFPPSTLAMRIAERRTNRETLCIARGAGRDSFIEAEVAADLPEDSIAIIDSPSDPLGSLVSTTDVVRLARACQYVVIDERFAEFSGFSMLPLAGEFDNVVVLRSFEMWAGQRHPSCAWAVASPRAALDLNFESAALPAESIAAALATLDNLTSVGATLRLIREERSRLYRLLRKLSFLEPMPSWGPFLAARVNLVRRRQVVDGLMARGIRVHAPTEPGLERYVRIGISSRTAMDRLRLALVDLAPELVS